MDTTSSRTWPTDALQAIKLDPAVLEAQITIGSNKKHAPSPKPVIPLIPETSTGAIKNIESAKFEEMMTMQKAALLSLAPQQFDLLLKFASLLRLQRLRNQKSLECAFCKKNGEPTSWFSSHMLKDNRGRVRCPVLRAYRCPGCGATGDYAHTIKHCPENPGGEDRWTRG